MGARFSPKSKLIQTLAHDSTTFGGGSAENMTAVRVDDYPKNTFGFANTCNQQVTVTFQACHDASFSTGEVWTLSETLVLADGSGTATVDYTTLSDAWTYVRPVATPGGNPTSGSFKFWHMAGE